MERLAASNTARDDTSTARDDTACSLSTLRAQAGKPLRDVVLDIYKQHGKANNKSTEFLGDLKCFLPTDTGDRRLYRHDGQIKHYVALSYPWYPSHGESNDEGGYHLPDRTVEVRDIVLDRTINFIRYKQGSDPMIPFWTDRLSIDQDDPIEHEIGMQSMDLVYKECTYAVGYLWVEIKTQVQVDRLSSLLSGRIVKEKPNKQLPVLEEGIDAQTVDEVLDLLVQITDDRWWSRAWIFQEDYLAGTKMWLLIRHTQGLDKSYARNELEHLQGELVVRSDIFRKYATLFCLALCQKMDLGPSVRNICEKILQRAGKYNILHRYRGGECNIQRAMTIDILKDLNKRAISVPSDFLAITANVCGYDIRIMAAKAKDDIPKMSLSLGILTLYISNGEITKNDDGEMSLSENLFDFLENRAMRISTPSPDGALTFMKHCRLSVSRLSRAGIHTNGILWKLSNPIMPYHLRQNSCPNRKSPSQKDIYRDGLDDYQRSRLSDLVKVLKKRNERLYGRLVNDLEAYVRSHVLSTRCDDWPPRFSMDIMASRIVNAMDTGKYLDVACIVEDSSGGQSTPYRAIFVRDRNEFQRSGPTYVFTSWTRTNEQVRDTVECKKLAKYVSMEVGVDRRAQYRLGGLRSKKWIDGLCFFDGEIKSSFIFAWPESLCE